MPSDGDLQRFNIAAAAAAAADADDDNDDAIKWLDYMSIQALAKQIDTVQSIHGAPKRTITLKTIDYCYHRLFDR